MCEELDTSCFSSINDNYMEKLEHVDAKDLILLERDLSFYDKVSITFLLFGDNQTNALYALQRLLVLSQNKKDETELLYSYSQLNTNWKLTILEGLSIIKANRCIRKLGFNIDEIRNVFLPHIPETSMYINPILKVLYCMCERLIPTEAGQLVLSLNETQNTSNHLRFYDHKYLEIYILDWITKSVINVGVYKDFQFLSQPNLDELLKYLKLNEFIEIKDMLLIVLNAIQNSPINSEQNKSKSILNINNNQPSTSTPKNSEIPIKRINERNNSMSTDYIAKFSNISINNNENDSPTLKNDSFECNHDDNYKIRKELAGFILIIDQRNFTVETNPELQEYLPAELLRERKGTEMDSQILAKTFESFGYIPLIKPNLTHLEMLISIKQIVERSIVYDSLIVCILSHGQKGIVYGSNSIPVQISKIEEILTSDSLLGKPKILIIQACQGTEYQIAKLIPKLEHDGPGKSAPSYSDMLVAMSTVPGFVSIRHCEKGSWFIQTLCKLINERGDRKHLMDILTYVHREVSNKRGYENQCMVPKYSITLRKSLFLPKRI